jgi:hypothetical protein
MRNPLSLRSAILPQLGDRARASLLASALSLVALGSSLLESTPVRAQTPEAAPSELEQILDGVDAAASSQDMDALMQFYDRDFTHADGLDRRDFKRAISQLWERYPNLRYDTELESWQRDNGAIVAETATQISGSEMVDDRQMQLTSTLRSRQRYEDGKIVSQEILSEDTRITSGENPPTVDVNLPERVRIGRDYHFDAIVQEPLGEDILLGAALDEQVKPENYFNSSELELELLESVGGLFKVGEAPFVEREYWISGVLIRADGLAIVTRRLHVEK